jgi:predicted HTH transcriptional regulator
VNPEEQQFLDALDKKLCTKMVASTFYRRGVIEAWGRGTLKIARLMQEAGHAPPEVSERPGAVVVTFRWTGAAATLGKTPPIRDQAGTKSSRR